MTTTTTPKEYEVLVFEGIKSLSPKLIKLDGESSGSCLKCEITSCKRFCPDVKGTFNGSLRFVADAKRYAPSTKISSADITNILKYKTEYQASLAFFVTTHGTVGPTIAKKLEENYIYVIATDNNENWLQQVDALLRAATKNPNQ